MIIKNLRELNLQVDLKTYFLLRGHLFFLQRNYMKREKHLLKKKNVIIYDYGKVEVYNLQSDPDEIQNLYFCGDEKMNKFIEEISTL